jgi:hypothetical protein
MGKIGNIEFHAGQDITKGSKVRFSELFPNSELWQTFELFENVEGAKTRMKVGIGNFCTFQTKANTTGKKGDKTGCLLILNKDDLSKKIAAAANIKKGDKVMVTFET